MFQVLHPNNGWGARSISSILRPMLRALIWVLSLVVIVGCASTKSDLERAMSHYEDARYETVVLWLNELEPELARMTPAERSTFLYLRGMSSYRLGQRDDALHFLALARESAAMEPGSLSLSLKSTLDRALAVLAEATHPATDTFGTPRTQL